MLAGDWRAWGTAQVLSLPLTGSDTLDLKRDWASSGAAFSLRQHLG